MKRLRVYVDTSVIGGCVEPKFEAHSRRLLEDARAGHLILLISRITHRELERSPSEVQQVLQELPGPAIEDVEITSEALDLADAYIAAGVIGPGKLADAQHIATATVNRADVLVSWNFKHIVNLNRVQGYNSVNLREGYPLLEIRTPREVTPHANGPDD